MEDILYIIQIDPDSDIIPLYNPEIWEEESAGTILQFGSIVSGHGTEIAVPIPRRRKTGGHLIFGNNNPVVVSRAQISQQAANIEAKSNIKKLVEISKIIHKEKEIPSCSVSVSNSIDMTKIYDQEIIDLILMDVA